MAEILTADDPSISDSTPTPTYGLFLNGVIVLKPDSFISYSYMNESKISSYPQESGGFQNYNKVETPYDVRIQMTKGGTVSEVAAFLQVVENLQKTTDLNMYDMITPERTYASCNVYKVSHDHKRDHGANMVTVDIFLEEIRVTASAFYSNTSSPTTTGSLSDTKTPAAADPKQAGTVQPATPTPAQGLGVSAALAEVYTSAETIVP